MSIEDQLAAILANEIRVEIDQRVIVELTHNWPDDVYFGGAITLPYGWAGEYCVSDTAEKRYLDIVAWIKDNINNPEQNAFWTKIGQDIRVLIRRPKDLTVFLLRWS